MTARRREPAPDGKTPGTSLLERMAPVLVGGLLVAALLVWLLGLVLGAAWAG